MQKWRPTTYKQVISILNNIMNDFLHNLDTEKRDINQIEDMIQKLTVKYTEMEKKNVPFNQHEVLNDIHKIKPFKKGRDITHKGATALDVYGLYKISEEAKKHIDDKVIILVDDNIDSGHAIADVVKQMILMGMKPKRVYAMCLHHYVNNDDQNNEE